MPETFTARIKKVWVMRCVDVPPAVVRALGGAARIPVLARYLGETVETTLTPGGGGCGRITLRMELLRPAGLDAGDALDVSLTPDRASREPETPADLGRALRFRPGAQAAWEAQTPAMRRQMVLYLDRAKSETTREKYVERVVESLLERVARRRDPKARAVRRPSSQAAAPRPPGGRTGRRAIEG